MAVHFKDIAFLSQFLDLKNKAINTQKTNESAEVPSSSTESVASCSSRANEEEPKECNKNADSTTDEPKPTEDANVNEMEPESDADADAVTNENENVNEIASANASENVETDADAEKEKEEETVEKLNDETNCDASPSKKSETKTNDESDDHKVDLIDSTIKLSCIEENSAGDDTLIDIEDPDDYLLYLETILLKIHTRFYSHYDETKQVIACI